jgi:hypothetical protein
MTFKWPVAFLAGLVCASNVIAQQAPFYVFPIQTIDGLTNASDNALIEPRVREFLGESAVKRIADVFSGSVVESFKGAVVSGAQVRETSTMGTTYQYLPSVQCSDDVFSVPISKAYGAVLGITRGSIYTIDKKGITEILIPITLNLQIWKPEKTKIAFSISDTVYSPFRFASNEVGRDSVKSLIRSQLLENIEKQTAFLVQESAKQFKPKDSILKIHGKDGGFIVVEGGKEAGFVVGEQVSANLVGPANENTEGGAIYSDVISAVSGVAILKPSTGGVSPAQLQRLVSGARLRFQLDQESDDSEKPVLLPITGFDANSIEENAAAEIFVKSVGFSSPFQVVSISKGATETHKLIKNQTRCTSWEKYDAAAQATTRKDTPNFFAKFDLQQSEILRKEGEGGVKTEDEFAVMASVKLLDHKMNVHYSELVVEPYKLVKTAGQGLQEKNATQIAAKNALLKLAASFVKDSKLESRELRVSKVDGTKVGVQVSGLTPEQLESATPSFYRELNVQVAGKKVLLPLRLGEPSAMARDGNDLVFDFPGIEKEYAPKAGDLVRLSGLSKPASLKIVRCVGDDFVSERTVIRPKFSSAFIENAVNASPKLQMVEVAEGLDTRINTLLKVGLFEPVVQAPPTPTACFQPGFAIRVENLKCETGLCGASVLNGLIAKLRLPSGAKDVQSVQRTAVEGFPEQQRDQYLSLRSMVWFNQLQADLKKKLILLP